MDKRARRFSGTCIVAAALSLSVAGALSAQTAVRRESSVRLAGVPFASVDYQTLIARFKAAGALSTVAEQARLAELEMQSAADTGADSSAKAAMGRLDRLDEMIKLSYLKPASRHSIFLKNTNGIIPQSISAEITWCPADKSVASVQFHFPQNIQMPKFTEISQEISDRLIVPPRTQASENGNPIYISWNLADGTSVSAFYGTDKINNTDSITMLVDFNGTKLSQKCADDFTKSEMNVMPVHR